ncbi:NAD(+)/NADH kinase [Nocardioides pacificus]
MAALAPRVVLVHRRTELEELTARHGTRGQVAFFLKGRGRDLDELEQRQAADRSAIETVTGAIPVDWRRGSVERADLDRFLFAPDDIVVVVGQDGLVANVAKYLDGQPVLGVNPEPDRNPGVLVATAPGDAAPLLHGEGTVEHRTMVEARTDDGQRLLALNEIYLGHPSHQTARYRLAAPGAAAERQASSGLIVATGTGSTGWCRSAWLERRSSLALPGPTERRLAWFVREAWPSPSTGVGCTEGELHDAGPAAALTIEVETDGLVAFGDGIESDRLTLSWGQSIRIGVAQRRLALVS